MPDTTAIALPPPVIRAAGPADIERLVELENRVFATDRLERRNFHYLLTKANAKAVVAEIDGDFAGYALLLFRRRTALARIYSLAVTPEARGRGVGQALLAACEELAAAAGAVAIRLEVRPDNAAAIALYRRAGFTEFGQFIDFYEDHAPALRFEKRLDLGPARPVGLVPYYSQITNFTCGPAALMMAMRALEPASPVSPSEEIRLWREATTIFMTGGPGLGGCDPLGLALAAHRRGFAVEVYVSNDQPLFLRNVTPPMKERVTRLVHEEFKREAAEAGLSVHHRPLRLNELMSYLRAGAIPIVLISLFRMNRERVPHWVVAQDCDDRYIFMHDPWIDAERMDSAADKSALPIHHREFERMSRYGRARVRAAVVVGRRPPP